MGAKTIGIGCLCVTVALAIWASPVDSAEQKSTSSAKAKSSKQAKQRKKASKGPARPGASANTTLAVLPKQIEQTNPKPKAGQSHLPLTSGKNFGNPLTADAFDEILASEMVAQGVTKAEKRISDDQFVRRVFLDTIGQLPSPADINEYVSSTSPNKKAELIDRLLAMPQFGTNWARYWRDVVVYRGTAGENRQFPFSQAEKWLADQINQNKPWNETVSAMLTVRGLSGENQQGFLIAAHEAKAEELAGEVSRIFLGIQIACAQCHDHPTDVWKRDQFHEFASFFGRTAARRRVDLKDANGGMLQIEIGEAPPRREYRKPDLKDPSKPGELVAPVFLTGQGIPQNTSDAQRRESFAQLLTSKRNSYFAKAYVNRMWCELMGHAFTPAVDDLGQQAEVTYPKVFEALTRSFLASNYDIKGLMRVLLNSSAYDRTFRQWEGSYAQTDLFKTISPARLSAEQIFDAVDWVVGGIDDGVSARRAAAAARGRPVGARQNFRLFFGFDPSADKREVEGTIPQALVLMNNPILHRRISAQTEGSLLNKLLRTESTDPELVKTLYLRVLARKPTAAESEQALAFVREVGNRPEAFEDLLWGLLNSSEFLHNH